MPKTLSGKLNVWRYIILRRITQIIVLLLFFGTAHWGWSLADRPILLGNLSGSTLLGFVPMADPFAVLQILLTRHLLQPEALIGAGIILGFYVIVGGRIWCSWVCPINMVTDLSGWLRKRFGVRDMFRLNRNIRYMVMALALGLSAIMGVAAFEWVSPISMFHRELIFGLGIGWMAILGVFLFDLLVLKNGWCGHLCPLGAFYGVVGKLASVRVRFDVPTCTHCGECAKVCPEPQVLNLKMAAVGGMVVSGECTNCGRCITVCPEHTLSFDWRPLISRHNHSDRYDLTQRRTVWQGFSLFAVR
jgi:ferredoxin-type protein NapH